MPEMMVWPDSWSVRTRNDGSSFARRCSARPIFSWSALVFGSTATRDHRLRELHPLERDRCFLGSHSVSPVVTSFRPTAAAMSPAWTSLISSRSLACICSRRPMRSLLAPCRVEDRVAGLQHARIDAEERQLADERIVQDLERERGERLVVARPGASSSVPSSTMPLTGGMSTGDGMYSTTASSIACTPLFLNAEPHSTGTISLRDACARAGRLLISSSVELAALEILVHQLLVASAAASTMLRAPLVALVAHLRRDLAVLELRARVPSSH